ncbi:MAG TPA: protein phosphatase CheZ [Steroidobacteraceae bacterium]|nr:protein phosphatase CheZ [Steroidobacteraceae bacterium]
MSVTLQQQWGEVCLALQEALEAGDEAGFLAVVNSLTGMRERGLWDSLRELDARLRAALDQFRLDPRLLRLAGKEMPDARARLDHVLRLTDEAAHRTMDLVERSTPLVARTAAAAATLAAQCQEVRASGAASPCWAELLARLESHFAAAHADGETVKTNLVEVLMAQSYQDLSGQIIRRVIELVAQLEEELARLVHGSEGALSGNRPAQPAAEDPSRGFGPPIPGVSASTVDGQQDVDELLAMGVAMKGM